MRDRAPAAPESDHMNAEASRAVLSPPAWSAATAASRTAPALSPQASESIARGEGVASLTDSSLAAMRA